jgi:hypothetical protein
MPKRESPRNPTPPHHPDDFSSWKEIASYLGVSVRRAQQWETELGLPVERFNTGQRARVRARRSEVDRWLRERTGPARAEASGHDTDVLRALSPPSPALPAIDGTRSIRNTRRLRWIAAAAAGLLLLAIGFWFAWPLAGLASSTPASAAIVNGELQALDARGRLLWRVGFPEGWARPHAVALPPEKAGVTWRTNTTLVQDVDGDGKIEVLFVYSTTMGNGAVIGDRLVCYGADGTERWRYSPGRKTQWRERQFDAAYSIWWVLGPLSIDGKPRLLVSASNSFFPCQISLLDATTGRLVGEYWHFGALLSGVVLDSDGDGRLEVVVGGVNTPGPGNGSPALVELKLPLPPPRPEVASVFDSPRSREAAYLLFPPIDAFAADPYPAAISWIRLDEWGRLQLAVSLGHNYPTKGQAYYTLDPGLSVTDIRADDLLKAYHEDLRRGGQLDHPLDEGEMQLWRQLRLFDTMPDANSPDLISTWPRREALPKPAARTLSH